MALLKSIGLDITYTDEGLRVVAERIGRLYVNAPRTLTADDPTDVPLDDQHRAAIKAMLADKPDSMDIVTALWAASSVLIHMRDGEATP